LLWHRTDPDLQRGVVRYPFGDEPGDRRVRGRRFGSGHLDQWVVGLAPADDVADVDVVLTAGPRHLRVRLEEHRHLTGERGDVSAFAPSEKKPYPSGGAAAASSSEHFVAVRIRCGTSLKLFGTRSHLPSWNGSRRNGVRNQDT
jgi:hypothetical protein